MFHTQAHDYPTHGWFDYSLHSPEPKKKKQKQKQKQKPKTKNKKQKTKNQKPKMWIKNRNYFQSKKNQEFFLILIKLGFFNILILLPKHPYYRPVKNWPNYHYYRPQKIEEIAEKKVVRNFLTNLIFLIFFEFFSENVLKTLLRGRETTWKYYWMIFEKYDFLMETSKK